MSNQPTKEQFNKLPQLDRIEFRQKRDYIDKHYEQVQFSGITDSFFHLMSFALIISLLLLINHSNEAAFKIFSLVPLIIKIFLGITIVACICNIVLDYKKEKQMSLLFDEYFKCEVKNEKRK